MRLHLPLQPDFCDSPFSVSCLRSLREHSFRPITRSAKKKRRNETNGETPLKVLRRRPLLERKNGLFHSKEKCALPSLSYPVGQECLPARAGRSDRRLAQPLFFVSSILRLSEKERGFAVPRHEKPSAIVKNLFSINREEIILVRSRSPTHDSAVQKSSRFIHTCIYIYVCMHRCI